MIQTLSQARSLLRSRLKHEPENQRGYIKNIIANLEALCGERSADEKSSVLAILPANIRQLERLRARRADVA